MSKSIPEVLYKYYSPVRKDIFENWTVRFSNPAHFNDVFETSWQKNDDISERERLQFRRALGIFCLTEDPDNHLMWVHYAAQHTGFVVGFKTAETPFSEGMDKPRKVKYRECPATIVPPSKEVCLYKDAHWRYEKEWRYVELIKTGEPRDFAIPPQSIAEVIFGSKMSISEITAILTCIDADFNIRLSISTLADRSHRITRAPYHRSLCPMCNGIGQVNDADGHLITSNVIVRSRS